MVSANSEGKIGPENHRNQRIIESFESEGTLGGYVCPAMNRDAYSSVRVLRAPSSLTFSVSKDGASTASLSSPC